MSSAEQKNDLDRDNATLDAATKLLNCESAVYPIGNLESGDVTREQWQDAFSIFHRLKEMAERRLFQLDQFPPEETDGGACSA